MTIALRIVELGEEHSENVLSLCFQVENFKELTVKWAVLILPDGCPAAGTPYELPDFRNRFRSSSSAREVSGFWGTVGPAFRND